MNSDRQSSPPQTLRPNRRYSILGLALACMAAIIIIQIIHLQISPEADKLREQNKLYARELHTFFPARGQILDRWGHLLAGNQTVYEVGVDLTNPARDPKTIALTLSKVLSGHLEYDNASYAGVIEKMASMEPITTTYRMLADFVSEEEMAQIKDWAKQYEAAIAKNPKAKDLPTLSGLLYTPHLGRFYPENDLMSNVIGFVNREGIGFFGVEERFNDLLAGQPIMRWMPRDPNLVTDLPNVPDGTTLILTIDRQLQGEVEGILQKALENTGAASGTAIVINPRNGDILVMATTTRLNLNEYWQYGQVFHGSTPFNRAVSLDYEPGSVFKVLTMAAGLDSGAVTPDTTFIDTGAIEVGGITIRNWNFGAWGEQTMEGCMEHSLNVCLAWIALETGATRFYQYMQSFGIGHLTGIELASEVTGRLKLPGDSDWFMSDLGTNAFGQGVATTPLQMAMAVSAIANDGKMMVPHILKAYVQNGRQYPVTPQMYGRPISADTAHALTDMLANSLVNEGSDALVPGYVVAGKTGTAEIPTVDGYTSNLTNASFVGWGPVDNPKFLVYVWLEKPTTSVWGSVVATPVFRQIVERVVVALNLPPDDVRRQMEKP